ncbi:hypothetical protein LZ009_21790, partial [Ramlibacter sp. XY19]|uniref:hypothetical protein n=1 Tax=Ramlibacter paludis TaxID=2908000 RepID=UPI0023D9A107
STRTRCGKAPRAVKVSVRLAAPCRSVPVTSNVKPHCWPMSKASVAVMLSLSMGAGSATGVADGPKFGVVAQTATNEPCLVLQSPVQVGQLITIAKLRPAEYVVARVRKPTSTCGSRLEPGHFYELEIPTGQNDWWASTAVIGEVPPGLEFRECYGSESVHLSVWRGPRRIWKGYYYVDYEMEPSCTPEDTAN